MKGRTKRDEEKGRMNKEKSQCGNYGTENEIFEEKGKRELNNGGERREKKQMDEAKTKKKGRKWGESWERTKGEGNKGMNEGRKVV